MKKNTNKPKSLLDLEANDCRWPIGDPRQDGFHFCGAQKRLGRPYCIEHWPLSFGTNRPQGQHASHNQHPRPALPHRRAA